MAFIVDGIFLCITDIMAFTGFWESLGPVWQWGHIGNQQDPIGDGGQQVRNKAKTSPQQPNMAKRKEEKIGLSMIGLLINGFINNFRY